MIKDQNNLDYNIVLFHLESIQSLKQSWKTDLKVFSLISNNQERKTYYIYSNQLLKAFNAKAKLVLKQP